MKFAFTDSRHIDGTVNKPANIFVLTLASKSEKKKKKYSSEKHRRRPVGSCLK